MKNVDRVNQVEITSRKLLILEGFPIRIESQIEFVEYGRI